MPVITNVNKQQAPSAIKTPALTLHKAKKDILALALDSLITQWHSRYG